MALVRLQNGTGARTKATVVGLNAYPAHQIPKYTGLTNPCIPWCGFLSDWQPVVHQEELVDVVLVNGFARIGSAGPNSDNRMVRSDPVCVATKHTQGL